MGTDTWFYLRDVSGAILAEYKNSSANLDYVNLMAGGSETIGQSRLESGIWKRYYYIKDHLGNIRQTLRDDGTKATVVSTEDYYPFGASLRSSTTQLPAQDKFKWSEKERDIETGLDYFGARMFDSQLGRFTSIDRFSGKYMFINPYQYAANNPLSFIDFNGDSLIKVTINDQSGYIKGQKIVIIDHRYLDELKKIINNAVKNGIYLRINSSFRTLKEQMGDRIQKGGTTPAKGESRHLAGLAIDFNLYTDNDPSKGVIKQNKGENENNNDFIGNIDDEGSRWGGNFRKKDPIHLDGGSNSDLNEKYNESFRSIRDFNQKQYDERGVNSKIKYITPAALPPVIVKGNEK